MTQPDTGPLSADEKAALDLTAELTYVLGRVVGHDRTRHGDLAELLAHVHAIQHALMSQAAARAYPDRFRLLGESLHRETTRG